MIISRGDATVFVTHPLSLALLADLARRSSSSSSSPTSAPSARKPSRSSGRWRSQDLLVHLDETPASEARLQAALALAAACEAQVTALYLIAEPFLRGHGRAPPAGRVAARAPGARRGRGRGASWPRRGPRPTGTGSTLATIARERPVGPAAAPAGPACPPHRPDRRRPARPRGARGRRRGADRGRVHGQRPPGPGDPARWSGAAAAAARAGRLGRLARGGARGQRRHPAAADGRARAGPGGRRARCRRPRRWPARRRARGPPAPGTRSRPRCGRSPSGGAGVADVLLAQARDEAADLLVMGGYGHSRLREMMLGGITRSILEHMHRARPVRALRLGGDEHQTHHDRGRLGRATRCRACQLRRAARRFPFRGHASLCRIALLSCRELAGVAGRSLSACAWPARGFAVTVDVGHPAGGQSLLTAREFAYAVSGPAPARPRRARPWSGSLRAASPAGADRRGHRRRQLRHRGPGAARRRRRLRAQAGGRGRADRRAARPRAAAAAGAADAAWACTAPAGSM